MRPLGAADTLWRPRFDHRGLLSNPPAPHFVAVGSEKERVRRYVERGEPVLLLGPSGCGKTTLLREVARELGRDIVPVTGGPSLGDGDLLGGYLFAGDR